MAFIKRLRARLKELGFVKLNPNLKELEHFSRVVFDEITININWDTIPEKLESIYIDMVIGRYLESELLKGNLGEYEGEPTAGDIASYKAGDVTISLNSSNNASSGLNRLKTLIDGLAHPSDLRYLLDCFRRAYEY